jgi:hypothetical protein
MVPFSVKSICSSENTGLCCTICINQNMTQKDCCFGETLFISTLNDSVYEIHLAIFFYNCPSGIEKILFPHSRLFIYGVLLPFSIFPFCGLHAAQSARPFGKPNGSVVSDSLSIDGYQNIRA